MRTVLAPVLLSAGLALLGCSQGTSPVAPASTSSPGLPPGAASLGTPLLQHDLAHAALGLWTLEVDATTLSATAVLLELRQGTANDDLYQLSIDNFLRPDSFRITTISATANELEIGYLVTHPFPAPADPTAPPNGFSNRADLGIAGQVLFLAEVPAATGNTYFTDRVANTALITNADAFYSPAGLLTLGTVANTFPYKVLVDESGPAGNRVGITNGGTPAGNFGNDGWNRANFGPANDGWTGYGVLHQGQAAANTIRLSKAALQAAGGSVSLPVAILAKYNDPRTGTTSAQKRANRLPGPTANPFQFGYRMPHGALDVERIAYLGESGGFLPNQVSASTLRFHLVDWDARAFETSESDLSLDPLVTTVAQGESGLPGLAVCIPGVLGNATVVETWDPLTDVKDNDSGYGGDAGQDSGQPGDALFYERTVTKLVTSGQSSGTYTGLVRATDPESGLVVPLDGTTLAPLTGNFPSPVTYQAFSVLMSLSAPPNANYVINNTSVANGGTVSITVSSLADAESDPIDILVDWDNDGIYTLATTVNAPYPLTVPLTSPITYTHNPPVPDTRLLPVRITDGTSTIDLLPTLSFTVAEPSVCGAPFAGTNRAAWSSTASLFSWVTFYGTATTQGPADFGAFQTATLREFIVQRYDNTSAVWDFYRLSTANPPVFTRISTFGAALSGEQAHQIEADSTHRVLFATKGPSSSDGDPNEIYGTSLTAQARTNIHWFDYDGSTMAASFTTINTGTNRVVAMTLDQQGNLYYIDTTNILHKLVKASNYTEDLTAPFPLDLKAGPYNIGPTSVWRVTDFVISFHNQAFFILVYHATSSATQPQLYRIECDGTMYTSTNSTNPVSFLGYYSNGGPDIWLDQWGTGGTLHSESDVQLVVANAILTAGNPPFYVFNTDLVPTANWTVTGCDSFGKIAIVDNVMLGKNDYYGPTSFRMNYTPPPAWQ